MMDVLRRHLFFIICGVAGFSGIALAVTGLRAMPSVMENMEEAERLYRDLQGLQSNPVNQDTLEARRRVIDAIKADHAKVLARAKKLYGYKPLVPDALPNGRQEKRYAFRAEYGVRINEMLASLNWGDLPTRDQIQIAEERKDQEDWEKLQDGTKPQSSGEALKTRAGVLTKEGVRTDRVARASVKQAQSIYCYAVGFQGTRERERAPSLDFDPAMVEGMEAPFPDEVWRAQRSFWIQKDVVDAIVAVNQEAAERVERDDRWVGIMPVKDVISIRIGESPVEQDSEFYSGAAPGGYSAALPSQSDTAVFTQSYSNATYDVIQFSVKLVMDQRDIPRFVEELCADSFHTPLRIAYQAVPINKKMTDKVYGPEPTVNVVLDFETILLNEVFDALIPRPEEEDEE